MTNTPAYSKRAMFFRWTALIGYFGLLGLLLNWHTWYSPPVQVPRSLVLIVLLVPLLFPLRGLLHARPYTHRWASYLTLPYFAIGIDTAYTIQSEWFLAALQIFLSLLMFIGCIFFARYSHEKPSHS